MRKRLLAMRLTAHATIVLAVSAAVVGAAVSSGCKAPGGPPAKPQSREGVGRTSSFANPAPGAPSREGQRPPGVLRACADPNNLPFSNSRHEGFENKIAELVARDLGERLEYTWWAQRRGFVRNTLKAGACDVVIGVPVNFDQVFTTRPYYRSTYVFVTRADGGPRVRSFDDPVLRRVRVGVQLIGNDQANSPPAHALSARHIVQNVRGYTVYGDYRDESPPSAIVRAVAARDIDVGVVWGPLAAFYARRQAVPLHLTPVSPQVDLPFLPFVFDIAMGVRRGDRDLRDRLDRAIERHQAEIDGILRGYGVPRTDQDEAGPAAEGK